MKILHFIPERTENKDVRTEYFRHLSKMSEGVEMRILTTDSSMRLDGAEKTAKILPVLNKKVCRAMEEFSPDIVHIHGCTGHYETKVFAAAQKYRIPVVVSPLGDLAAMTLAERSKAKRLSSDGARARKMLWGADAIHVTGELEMETVRKMQIMPDKDLNRDIVRKTFMIKNSVLTNSITAEKMCHDLIGLYRKVIGWRPYDVMRSDTRECEKLLLRTGTCRMYSKISEEDYALARKTGEEEMEKIFVHSEIQGVRELIDRGCREFGIPFAPERSECRRKAGMENETDDDMPVFRHIEKLKSKHNKILRDFESYEKETELFCIISEIEGLMQRGQLRYRHLCELCAILVSTDYHEDIVGRLFKHARRHDFAARIMQITAEYAGLPEGFMPIPPLNDKKTKDIITFITLKSR